MLTYISNLHNKVIAHGKLLGRSVGLELTLDDFQKVSDQVPFLADLKPSGKYVMEDVHKVQTYLTFCFLSMVFYYHYYDPMLV